MFKAPEREPYFVARPSIEVVGSIGANKGLRNMQTCFLESMPVSEVA